MTRTYEAQIHNSAPSESNALFSQLNALAAVIVFSNREKAVIFCQMGCIRILYQNHTNKR